MKILVFGAGVLGSLYAARLQQAGNEVSILARGARLDFIRQNGIVLEHVFSGKRLVSSVQAVDRISPSDAYDLIIVIVRRNQASEALKTAAENTAAPNILVMVNNPSGYDEWTRIIGRERLLVGFAGAGGTNENGVIRYLLAPGFFQPTTLAEVDGSRTQRLERIVDEFRKAGFPTAVSANMDAWQKTHVAWVSPLANAVYLAEKQGRVMNIPMDILKLTVEAVREGLTALKRLGIPVTPPLHNFWLRMPGFLTAWFVKIWSKTRHFDYIVRRHSLAAKDEMYPIAEEFRALAAKAGTATPALESMWEGMGLEHRG